MNRFHDVPTEICARIFIFCLPRTKYTSPDPLHAPILLTHVCSLWRNIAHATSPLWQSLNISTIVNIRDLPTDEAKFYLDTFMAQMALWNQGARGHHLSLMLQLGEKKSTWERPHTKFWYPLMRLAIQENYARLRKLYLAVDSIQYVYDLPSVCIPILESLHFEYPHSPDPMPEKRIKIFSQAPLLKKVILNLHLPVSDHVDLPWSQLSHLVINTGSPTLFRSILKECLALEALTMTIYMHDVPDITPPLPINAAPSLQKLKLTPIGGTPAFFTRLFFPQIQEFEVCGHRNVTFFGMFHWFPFTSAHTHLLNQLYHLRTLKLGWQLLPLDMLIGILRSTPDLVELVVEAALEDYTAFLRSLTYHPDSPSNIIPQLQTFTLFIEIQSQPEGSNTSCYPFKSDDFLAMVVSRAKPNPSSLANPDSIGDDLIPHPLKKVSLRIVETTSSHALDTDALLLDIKNHADLSAMEFKLEWDVERLQHKIETW